ncbi:MAG: prevent-host-death protein [Bacteroidota bacterium]|nr:prevent-host-death protein [Bacteroidota bacterium]
MQAINVGELKTNFSEILKRVQAGEEIAILFGKRKKVVAKLVPEISEKKSRRKIGILDKKGSVKFNSNFKMTEAEFLGI